VALPFAEAFRLGAILSDVPLPGVAADVDRQFVLETVIPPFTYETEPPVPSELLPTVATRLLLVTHERVSPETVEVVLGAIFDSPFARIPYPSLDRSVFDLPPRLALHPGTEAFRAHDRPFITRDVVGSISSSLSIFGATLGAVLFFVRSFRQRSQARREALFSDTMLRVANIERRVVERELAATLELEPLVGLQREILQLKSEALERFAAGELGGHGVITDLLTPINSAHEHIGELLLHVRENLEERAGEEGRSARSLWAAALQRKDPAAPPGTAR
jgi:hypothetical protein